MNPYNPPQFEQSAFHCPNCHAFAAQEWGQIQSAINQTLGRSNIFPITCSNQVVLIAKCSHCQDCSVWLSTYSSRGRVENFTSKEPTMIYPSKTNIISPNQDLPEEIKIIYNEAASIIDLSPKGSAALLRLALQMLLIELGGEGKNIKADIQKLLKAGLDSKLEKALEFVRVIGNNAVHPKSIDLNDRREFAISLFNIINFITEELISKEKRINSLYEQLPEEELKWIEESNTPLRLKQD